MTAQQIHDAQKALVLASLSAVHHPDVYVHKPKSVDASNARPS